MPFAATGGRVLSNAKQTALAARVIRKLFLPRSALCGFVKVKRIGLSAHGWLTGCPPLVVS
jgi:hypothetical protein